jgi:hypothetical protein
MNNTNFPFDEEIDVNGKDDLMEDALENEYTFPDPVEESPHPVDMSWVPSDETIAEMTSSNEILDLQKRIIDVMAGEFIFELVAKHNALSERIKRLAAS